jgi:hypothetical protein
VAAIVAPCGGEILYGSTQNSPFQGVMLAVTKDCRRASEAGICDSVKRPACRFDAEAQRAACATGEQLRIDT